MKLPPLWAGEEGAAEERPSEVPMRRQRPVQVQACMEQLQEDEEEEQVSEHDSDDDSDGPEQRRTQQPPPLPMEMEVVAPPQPLRGAAIRGIRAGGLKPTTARESAAAAGPAGRASPPSRPPPLLQRREPDPVRQGGSMPSSSPASASSGVELGARRGSLLTRTAGGPSASTGPGSRGSVSGMGPGGGAARDETAQRQPPPTAPSSLGSTGRGKAMELETRRLQLVEVGILPSLCQVFDEYLGLPVHLLFGAQCCGGRARCCGDESLRSPTLSSGDGGPLLGR